MRVKTDLYVLQARAASLRRALAHIGKLASLPDEEFWGNKLYLDSIKLHSSGR